MSSLKSLLGEDAAVLSYINPDTGNYRALRVVDGVFLPPKGSWIEGTLYWVSKLPTIPTNLPNSSPSNSELSTPTTDISTETKNGAGSSDADITMKELSKAEVRELAKKSAVARTALFHWNRMNTSVRRLVHSKQFHGTGALSKCEGTTKEEGIKNTLIREEISRDPSVRKWLRTFALEHNQGKVTLDEMKASDHVRHVLNEMRRSRNATEIYVDNSSSIPLSGPIASSKSNTPKPVRAQRKRSATAQKACFGGSRTGAMGCDEESNGEEYTEDCDDKRSEYERERARNIQELKEVQFSMGLIKDKSLAEDDLVVIARSFLKAVGCFPTKGAISDQIEELGLKTIESGGRMRNYLIHFGKELYTNGMVQLKATAGLTFDDVVIKQKLYI